eukprot:7325178-Prymnesium_polylepis.3
MPAPNQEAERGPNAAPAGKRGPNAAPAGKRGPNAAPAGKEEGDAVRIGTHRDGGRMDRGLPHFEAHRLGLGKDGRKVRNLLGRVEGGEQDRREAPVTTAAQIPT